MNDRQDFHLVAFPVVAALRAAGYLGFRFPELDDSPSQPGGGRDIRPASFDERRGNTMLLRETCYDLTIAVNKDEASEC